MAVFKFDPSNGIAGKAGSHVTYNLNGKWVMRGLPKFSAKNKHGSTAQNLNRSKFKTAQQFLKPLIPLLKKGYSELQGNKKGITHNLAMSYFLNNSFDDQGQIDYAKVCISVGTLKSLPEINVSLDDNTIIFTWDTSLEVNKRQDQLLLVAYDPGNSEVEFTSKDYYFMDGKAEIELGKFSGNNNFHVWVGSINDDRTKNCTSQYLGLICKD